MGLLDFVEDAADFVADTAGDIAGAAADAADWVGDTASDVADWAGGAAADAASWAGGAAADVFDAAANFTDDTIFDSVDFITGGVIDVDYDGGNFSANIGIDDVAKFGVSVGEDGFKGSFDTAIADGNVAITDEGFSLSGSAGIDFGPLPYAEGHLAVSADGDVMVNGRVQGTIPTPAGLLTGQASGGFVRTDEGWGAFVDADGKLTMPSGTTITGGVTAAYQEDADGSRTMVGVEGSISSPGVGSAGGSVGYTRIEEDGNVVETLDAEGHAEGFGVRVDAEGHYLGIETEQGSYSEWSGDVDIDGLDAESLVALGSSVLGMDDSTLTEVLGKAAEVGVLEDLLGGLDPAATEQVIGRLVGAPVTAAPVGSAVDGGATGPAMADDVLGDTITMPNGNTGVVGPGYDPALDDPIVASDGTAVDGDGGPMDDGDMADDVLGGEPIDDVVGVTAEPAYDTTVVDEPAYEPADEPADDFSEQIEAADAVEDGFDTMFDDLDGSGA